jgi:hypothetical protein
MIAWASQLEIGVGRFSRMLGGVGMRAMLNAGLDTKSHIEVAPGAGVHELLVTRFVVRVFIDRRCVVEEVEVMR